MRRLMRSLPLRIAVLLWVAGFFVVFIPAHRRGAVQLPGHGLSIAGQPYCPLCVVLPMPSDEDGSGAPSAPSDAPVSCAVCFLKAGLDTPSGAIRAPTLVADLAFTLRLLAVIEAERRAATITLHGPAPPSC